MLSILRGHDAQTHKTPKRIRFKLNEFSPQGPGIATQFQKEQILGEKLDRLPILPRAK